MDGSVWIIRNQFSVDIQLHYLVVKRCWSSYEPCWLPFLSFPGCYHTKLPQKAPEQRNFIPFFIFLLTSQFFDSCKVSAPAWSLDTLHTYNHSHQLQQSCLHPIYHDWTPDRPIIWPTAPLLNAVVNFAPQLPLHNQAAIYRGALAAC